MGKRTFRAVVFGGSAGSMDALSRIFSGLPEKFAVPIITVCHLHPEDEGGLVDWLGQQVPLRVREACDKEEIRPGHIYLPPANYHLLVERQGTFALSFDAKINYSRPSIDVLLESAAVAWGDELVAILLTGANNDGSAGITAVKKYGGLTIVQDPRQAAYPVMPQSAIDTGNVDLIFTLAEIIGFLHHL